MRLRWYTSEIGSSCRAAAMGLALLFLLTPAAVVADQVAILDSPDDAIAARINILESASESIDVLYFSIHDDQVTRATLGILRELALEGVEVRIITAAKGFQVDPAILYHLQTLDTFEVRLYNVGMFRQLHDKVILVDGDRYITGGRNLGEVYFDLAATHNKKDRDIYVVGPSAEVAQKYFDDLWKSSEVVPPTTKPYTGELLDPDYCEHTGKVLGSPGYETCIRGVKQRRAGVDAAIASLEQAVAIARDDEFYDESLGDLTPFLADIPGDRIEFVHDPVEAPNTRVARILDEITAEIDGDILVQSPYVVPDKEMFGILESLQEKGVGLTYVTNSIKSTVNVLGYAGYARYRKKMLDLGVTFVESTGDQMLHAKSFVARSRDGSCIAGIGSFNIDPRSANLNTETFVVVRDCGFADELEQYILKYAADGITVSSRDDLAKLSPVKKEAPMMKRFQVGLFKFLTPLYRSQI